MRSGLMTDAARYTNWCATAAGCEVCYAVRLQLSSGTDYGDCTAQSRASGEADEYVIVPWV